eukprot:CAMPEP_0181210114 /NCGR_PEP_ID=MMETSP1096-20121128/23048_1 /TAXON_ID=156174 ORGANISM="Chrysochromulina ericina, Strain CCMP281" /NCGR_SAMPLE_ID=MMETSP1096 /ASSEMBLY_ACC=CAM_ASM_000453 /LENGTH=120 /DNA_ID=CAMNT_0023301363 /DNA_START=137 /DNA_END=497 /DNA_ORIENTATION=-
MSSIPDSTYSTGAAAGTATVAWCGTASTVARRDATGSCGVDREAGAVEVGRCWREAAVSAAAAAAAVDSHATPAEPRTATLGGCASGGGGELSVGAGSPGLRVRCMPIPRGTCGCGADCA